VKAVYSVVTVLAISETLLKGGDVQAASQCSRAAGLKRLRKREVQMQIEAIWRLRRREGPRRVERREGMYLYVASAVSTRPDGNSSPKIRPNVASS
jgi:hypothetical protein